mmetsp:Transcript_4006/g.10573  ORF Transcript_4006/g.10573 Transcript_4006/m.10573 type:complete len:97 (-) Transcript_4006:428-718(-)
MFTRHDKRDGDTMLCFCDVRTSQVLIGTTSWKNLCKNQRLKQHDPYQPLDEWLRLKFWRMKVRETDCSHLRRYEYVQVGQSTLDHHSFRTKRWSIC